MNSDDARVDRILIDTVRQAYTEAFLSTIEALASEVGVENLQGTSIRQFFADVAREETERRIGKLADEDPGLGTELLAKLKVRLAIREKELDDEVDLGL